MKVSYCSDLHLEFGTGADKTFSQDEGGDVLILAGDIFVASRLRPEATDANSRGLQKYIKNKFKPNLLDKYKHVLQVMGNHEHYSGDINTSKRIIQEFYARIGVENVTVMENNTKTIGDVTFVGNTLWTNFCNANPLSMQMFHLYMNDSRMIDDGFFKLRAESVLDIHRESLNYIDLMTKIPGDQAFDIVNRKYVVITHHVPSFMLNSKSHTINTDLDGCYATALEDFICMRPQITHWICGHTHGEKQLTIGNTEVLQKCCGYPMEDCFNRFKELGKFEV